MNLVRKQNPAAVERRKKNGVGLTTPSNIFYYRVNGNKQQVGFCTP